MEHTNFCEGPLGKMFLSSDGESLTGLWFEGQPHIGPAFGEETVENSNLPLFAIVGEWLEAYFAGQRPEPSGIPLAPAGTKFFRSVWDAILAIPYGETAAYGEIARRIGCPSARPVGGAVGRNPISIIIPCHRVVGANGSLTGYAGGLERKAKLLELEGAKIPLIPAPEKGGEV